MDIKQPFQVGDKVRAVDPNYHPDWINDWQAVELWVAGIHYSVSSGGFDIWVSEKWPPTSLGDISDGWSEELLAPR